MSCDDLTTLRNVAGETSDRRLSHVHIEVPSRLKQVLSFGATQVTQSRIPPRHMGPHPRRAVRRGVSPTRNLQVSQINPNSELHETALLLRLIHHRNKNQHRTQKWWRWLCTLRRSVRKLLETEMTRDERGGWMRREDEEQKQRVERWMREVVISKAWLLVLPWTLWIPAWMEEDAD